MLEEEDLFGEEYSFGNTILGKEGLKCPLHLFSYFLILIWPLHKLHLTIPDWRRANLIAQIITLIVI